MEVGGLRISAALPSASLERPVPPPLRLRHPLFSSPSHRAAASFQRSCVPATPISSVRVRHRAASPESSRQRARVIYSGGDSEDDGLGVGEEAAGSSSSPSSSSQYFVAAAALLSLSEKPDRSVALLDEYEMEELDPPDPNHRSGYVAVLGKPNVGKSTLSNQMIGQKLSIVTDKPQTTRHRILSICSGPEYQMILYDTPGVIERKMHKLDSMMMKNVRSATVNADCVLVVVDACKVPQKIDEVLEEGVGNLKDKLPVLLVLNKKDMIKPGEIAKRLEWYQKFTDVDEVIPVSAKYGQGIDDVKEWILSKLPFGPAYYPKDIASEHPERFFVAEIVREKIFLQYRNEVPYACQVNVVNYISRPTSKDYIVVEIVVEKNSQKIILIGKEGKALKLLATAARLDIEDFLQKKVFLEVEVKVKANWRQDEGLLKRPYHRLIQISIETGSGQFLGRCDSVFLAGRSGGAILCSLIGEDLRARIHFDRPSLTDGRGSQQRPQHPSGLMRSQYYIDVFSLFGCLFSCENKAY